MAESFFTTGFHIKALWAAVVSMIVGWAGGISWSAKNHETLAKEIQCVKYDSGVRLAAIETSLRQINFNLIELKQEIRNKNAQENTVQKEKQYYAE